MPSPQKRPKEFTHNNMEHFFKQHRFPKRKTAQNMMLKPALHDHPLRIA